jgi:hypothetical protein
LPIILWSPSGSMEVLFSRCLHHGLCKRCSQPCLSSPADTSEGVAVAQPCWFSWVIRPLATFALPYVLHNGFKDISLDCEQESLLLQALCQKTWPPLVGFNSSSHDPDREVRRSNCDLQALVLAVSREWRVNQDLIWSLQSL